MREKVGIAFVKLNKLALIYEFTNMLYLLSHSPSHLPDILGSGWVSNVSHDVPQMAPSEGLKNTGN